MPPVEINYFVEGAVDAAVARAMLRDLGATPDYERIAGGKSTFDARIDGYNAAAAYAPWLALRDLDSDAACAPELYRNLVPQPSANLCFRISVCEIESWLMADRNAFAAALGVPAARIPVLPDQDANPKQTVVNLARRSRKQGVVRGLVPDQNAGISIGPEYAAWMIEFAETKWNPARAVAENNSPSLSKAYLRLQELIDRC